MSCRCYITISVAFISEQHLGSWSSWVQFPTMWNPFLLQLLESLFMGFLFLQSSSYVAVLFSIKDCTKRLGGGQHLLNGSLLYPEDSQDSREQPDMSWLSLNSQVTGSICLDLDLAWDNDKAEKKYLKPKTLKYVANYLHENFCSLLDASMTKWVKFSWSVAWWYARNFWRQKFSLEEIFVRWCLIVKIAKFPSTVWQTSKSWLHFLLFVWNVVQSCNDLQLQVSSRHWINVSV